MTQDTAALPITPDTFKANFGAIAPLILEEWPSISHDSLMATEGEFDRVVDHVASVTDRTRLLILRFLLGGSRGR